MSGGLAGTYFTLLQQFDQKAIPQPTGDNTQIQKVAAPTDSAVVSDSSLVTATVGTPPFKYGVAQYGQAQYGAMYKNVILGDKPVAYYRLDETAKPEALDWSGNGNNGTINSGVTLGQPGAINDGDAGMKFDGTSGYIQLPATTDVPYPISLEAWAYPSNFGSSEGIYVMATDPGIRLRISPTGYPETDIQTNGTWYPAVVPANPVTLNQWCHMVVTYDGTTHLLYVNGVQVTSNAVTGPITYNSATPYVIGADNYYQTPYHEFMNGSIDEVAIYNYALSADQVQRHYNAAAWK